MNEQDGIEERTRVRQFRVLHQGWECVSTAKTIDPP